MARRRRNGENELVFLPLGGAGEIGMNVYLYGYGQPGTYQWVMVDCGVTFPDSREPGVEVVLPNLRFIEEERGALTAIVLTHAHEDHFGAVAEMWPRLRVPVYGTPFTIGMLKEKLDEYEYRDEVPLHVVQPGGRIEVGPFDIDFVNVAHSIPQASSLIIRTPLGTVLHTGDWRLDAHPGVGDPTDEAKLRALGDEGLDVLICDSTNILSNGFTASEIDVAATLTRVIAKARARVAVTSFASNVSRLLAVARAAEAADRHVVLVGRSMHRIVEIARDTGLWPEKVKTLTEEDYGHLPPETVVALVTGSQGEMRAALARIAEGQHPMVTLSPGDMVVYSARTIPGNEESVIRIMNKLAETGVEMVTEAPDGPIHTSGHPRRGEVARLYEWVRPKSLVPMHGESRHLQAHVEFAAAHGINAVKGVRNGTVTRLLPGNPSVIDEAPVGRIYRDGRLRVSEDDDTIRERRKLSIVGTVAVSVVMTAKTGEMAADPRYSMVGLPETDTSGEPLSDVVEKAIFGAFDSIPRPRRKDAALVEEAIRKSVRAAVNQVWGKKPICAVMVSVI